VDVGGDADVVDVGVGGEVAGVLGVDEAVSVEVAGFVVVPVQGAAEEDDVDQGFAGCAEVAAVLGAVLPSAGAG